MSHIYIVSDHGKLIKKNRTLQLVREDVRQTIFPHKTDKLVVIGRIDISSPALGLLMYHRIDTIFLGRNGRYNGRIDFREGKNVFLRRKQYELLDTEKALTFAAAVVGGKLHNQLTLMRRFHRKQKEGDPKREAVGKSIQEIEKLIRSCPGAETLESLRGFEGAGARAFFSVYRLMIRPEWAVFNGRSMHPPGDNVNAVLSFLYTMLLYQVEYAVALEGLDSYVGYLHKLDYGRKSLLFDLMEEFRTPIGDSLTAGLFNNGVLGEEDFESTEFRSDDERFPLDSKSSASREELSETGVEDGDPVVEKREGTLLTREGLPKVIEQLERKFEAEIYHEGLGRHLNYKQLIHEQVKKFKRFVNGEEAEYTPFRMR